MSAQTKNIIIVFVIVFGFGGLSVYLNQSESSTETATATSENELVVAGGTDVSESDISDAGSYQLYSEAAVAASTADKKILFFHATWCPSCKVTDADLKDSLADIPPNVAIFKTDYDTETALRQKHGVTLQHSYVLLDENGGTAKRWINSRLLEDILAEL